MIIIIALVIFFIYYKLFAFCVKEGKKYCKNSKVQVSVRIPIEKPLKNYMQLKGEFNDSFGYVQCYEGAVDIYMDKHGTKYFEGIFTADNPYLITKPSVIVADIEHYGQMEWHDKYGKYEAIKTRNMKTDTIVPVANYFTYHPETCPICGAPIEYKPQNYPFFDNSKMYLAAPKDSHDRYCPHCNEILKRDTETYYPFFIDTINKEIITYKDKNKFEQYMNDCVNINNILTWIVNTPESDLDWVTFDESLLTKKNLSEYTKNSYVAPMWQRLKVLK